MQLKAESRESEAEFKLGSLRYWGYHTTIIANIRLRITPCSLVYQERPESKATTDKPDLNAASKASKNQRQM